MTCVTITNPKDRAVQASFLKLHCKMVLVGGTPRGGKKNLLNAVSNVTGKSYTTKQFEKAVNDLQEIVDAAIQSK